MEIFPKKKDFVGIILPRIGVTIKLSFDFGQYPLLVSKNVRIHSLHFNFYTNSILEQILVKIKI